MQQGISLIEPLLHFRIFCSDGQMRLTDAGDLPRLLARTAVERFTMKGMALQIGRHGSLREKHRRDRQESEHPTDGSHQLLSIWRLPDYHEVNVGPRRHLAPDLPPVP